MRLAIVGAVYLDGNEEAARIIEEVLDRLNPAVVVSGGAKGIDTMAETAAIRRGIKTDIYRPERPGWATVDGKKGYAARNIEIADNCDYLVRIAWKKSKTYGSGFTRDKASARGVPTEEYMIDA